MNVAVQAINLIIFFCIFYFWFAKKISDWLSDRKELIKKLQTADEEYQSIVKNAERAAKEIILDANTSKKSIIDEATIIAKNKADELIDQAKNKADSILSTAQVQAVSLKSELEDQYEHMVKFTAGSYLKKIFDDDPELQSVYLNKVTKGVVG